MEEVILTPEQSVHIIPVGGGGELQGAIQTNLAM